MILYLDVFIIQNFIVNLFLLYITVQTLRIKGEMIRMIIASAVGVIYAVISLLSQCKYLFFIPFKIVVAIIMTTIVFRKNNVIFLVKATIVFILYAMLIAGICIFIEINNSNNTRLILNKFSYKSLLSSIMIIYIFMHKIVSYVKDRIDVVNFIYDVDIVTEKGNKKVKAFLDTGNELREPATDLPVMVVEKDIIESFYMEIKNKFIIPYKVVNGFTGELKGFKPKYINIYKSNKIEKRQVIIALCDNKLSNSKDYNALLSRGIL